MPNDISGVSAGEWELSPSTRMSVALWSKKVPVDVTLTTPGTAQDLITIGTTTGAGESIPAVNLVPNPSFEVDTTGYTAAGSTILRVTTQFRNGVASLQVTPNNAAVGEGVFLTTDTTGSGEDRGTQYYVTASAYFRKAAGGQVAGQDARIEIRNLAGATPALAVGNTILFDTTWQRSVVRLPITAVTGSGFRIYLVTATQHAIVFFIDSIQVEVQRTGNATVYTDGSLGIGYEWDGTANASVSRRRYGLMAIRGYRLHNTGDIYFAEDYTASITTGEYIRAGTDFDVGGIHLVRRLSFVNVIAGESPRVYGAVYGDWSTRHIT